MTAFLLLRHAAHDNLGQFLAGRMPGLHLGEAGHAQAGRFAERLRREKITALYCSPRERTRQTAEAIAANGGLAQPRLLDALDEIDFGAWSGRTFAELDDDPNWHAWNAQRSRAVTAGGESFSDVQRRVVTAMEALGSHYPDATIGLVSHADVIKAAVMAYLGMGIDDWWRIEVSPASITRIVMDNRGTRLVGLNEVID